jgi:hypothetical protein
MPSSEKSSLFRYALFTVMHNRLLGLALLLGLLGMGACSSPPALQKTTLTQPPSVDGALNEWGGGLSSVDEGVSMSAAPTDSLLYVAAVVSDPALIRAVARHGLILWVDPTGARASTYGLQYPIGLAAQRPARGRRDASAAPDARSPGSRLDQLLPSDVAVIRNDTIRHRRPSRLVSALKARVTLDPGVLVYEVGIPLQGTAQNPEAATYGLRTPLTGPLALGLQTPNASGIDLQGATPSGIPSVTGSGRRTSPQRRERPPASPQRTASLDLWVTVPEAAPQP